MDYHYFKNKLFSKKHLSRTEASALLGAVIEEKISPVQIASLLTLLTVKEPNEEEMFGFISEMRDSMRKITSNGIVIDTCGTGGDGFHTFNISTTVAFVVAGAGVKVAKHGNKAASSKCGSADVLEALGVNTMAKPEDAEKILKQAGMVFLFAPVYHASLKPLMMVRKELGFPTVFNYLGPFCNPAGVKRQIIGIPQKDVAAKLAKMATRLHYENLMIVSNEKGMDEIGLDSDTHVWNVQGTKVRKTVIHPLKYGFKKVPVTVLEGGDAKENAKIVRAILKGEEGSRHDIVVLNAAVALKAAEVVQAIPEGIKLAEKSISSGAALAVLKKLVEVSQSYA